MGQYYRVVMIRGGKATYYNRDVKPDKKAYGNLLDWEKNEVDQKGCYYTMAKLMEHSYVDNQFVDAITENLIKNGAAEVAWVGDYAHLPTEYAAYNPWDREGRRINYYTPDTKHVLSGKCIINETKGQVIMFDYYYEANKWTEVWTDENGKKHNSIWCISPIPLLTACGNGLGGGDYHGSDMSYVGSWAFDEIRIADEKEAEKYTVINPVFKE